MRRIKVGNSTRTNLQRLFLTAASNGGKAGLPTDRWGFQFAYKTAGYPVLLLPSNCDFSSLLVCLEDQPAKCPILTRHRYRGASDGRGRGLGPKGLQRCFLALAESNARQTVWLPVRDQFTCRIMGRCTIRLLSQLLNR